MASERRGEENFPEGKGKKRERLPRRRDMEEGRTLVEDTKELGKGRRGRDGRVCGEDSVREEEVAGNTVWRGKNNGRHCNMKKRGGG